LIRSTWIELVGGNAELLCTIDKSVVETVELRVPAISLKDKQFLDGSLERLNPIVYFHAQQATDQIPSLGTLFADLKYLQPLAMSMKILIDSDAMKSSIFSSFEHMFQGEPEDFDRSYQELWLFAMRNFPKMVSTPPPKSPKTTTAHPRRT
jgi:hypothetical protein